MSKRPAPFNLAPEQNLVLMLLRQLDGLSQQEIAKRPNKDKTNVAHMAVNLEQKELIRKVYNHRDRRSLNIYLTDKDTGLSTDMIPSANKVNGLL
ncbi:MarR family transcriptional regulator [Bacillus xiapuensis]|uniref:MarR family transcriptional regulator n=1 Tax=Bacillus xiapuensis TaxID=2014075 RepID=UPI000C24AE19|nr:MarR family transcriptional regulator [Bacillus xiapuensis]